MRLSTWRIREITGYEPKTTFYEDFSIADRFGTNAVKDTYNRGLLTAESLGHEFLTEFVMVLNWKIWEHHERNEALARVYNDLWELADNYAREHLTGEALSYYYDTTD